LASQGLPKKSVRLEAPQPCQVTDVLCLVQMGQPKPIEPEALHDEQVTALHAELEARLRARGIAPFSTLEDFWQRAGIRPEDLSDEDLHAFSDLPEILRKIRDEDRRRAP
jgi:hypothetical protein